MFQKKSQLQDLTKRSLAISVGANKVFDIRADIACQCTFGLNIRPLLPSKELLCLMLVLKVIGFSFNMI